jgi:hypothetical protein
MERMQRMLNQGTRVRREGCDLAAPQAMQLQLIQHPSNPLHPLSSSVLDACSAAPRLSELSNLVSLRPGRHFSSMSDRMLAAAALGDRVVANVRDYRADAWMSKVIP